MAWRSMPTVPDGWFDYSPFGTPIAESRIIAVKTPLKQAFNNRRKKSLEACPQVDYRSGVSLEDEFTPTQLVERLKADGLNLRAVIDLTFTKRYYNPEEFVKLGVKYKKVMCPGKEIPNDTVYSQFVSTLSDFLKDTNNGDLVAVHCTHGLNRTGYLVCRYLIECCSYSVEDAIQGFNKARGYDIERVNYLEHLRNGCPPLVPKSPKSPISHPRTSSHAPACGKTVQNRQNGASRQFPQKRNRKTRTLTSDSPKRDKPYSIPASNATNQAGDGEGRGNRRVRLRHRRQKGKSHEPSAHQVEPLTSKSFESNGVSHRNSQTREGEGLAQARGSQNHLDASQWHGSYSNNLHPEFHSDPRQQPREREQLHSPARFDHTHTGNGEPYLFDSREPPMYGHCAHGYHGPPEPIYSVRFQAPPRHLTPSVQTFHGPPTGWMYNDDQYYYDFARSNLETGDKYYGRPKGAFSRWSGN